MSEMKKKWVRRKLHELAEGLDKAVASVLGLADRNFATLEGRMSDMRETLHRRILTLEKWRATLDTPIREKSFEYDVINMGAVCAARWEESQTLLKGLSKSLEGAVARADDRMDGGDEQDRQWRKHVAELDQALTAALVRIAALEDGGKVDAAPMLDKPEPESAQSAEPKEWIGRPGISRRYGAIGGGTVPSSTLEPSGVPEGDYPDTERG